MFLEYTNLEEESTSLPTTSAAFASMTTSHARLKLYELIGKLGNRLVHCDADSCIYEHAEGEFNCPAGSFLGDWECETEGKPLTKFVSIGPKSYSYKDDNKIITKFKGFTLNYKNSGIIDFDSIKSLVDGDKREWKTNLNLIE